MTIQELSESELFEAGVSSLSNRPTSPYAWGGEGLTPSALKARFDSLPRLVAERLNALLRLLHETPSLTDPTGSSMAEAIKSGLSPSGHTLADFFREVLDGTASGYLRVGDESLADALAGKEEASRVLSESGEGTLPLVSDVELRLGELGDLTLTLPASPKKEFAATLVFDTKPQNGDSRLHLSERVCWSGDDTVDGSFLPFGGRHYTCMIWYDGSYQGIVRSVPR